MNAKNYGTTKIFFSIFTATSAVRLKLQQQGTYKTITHNDDSKYLFPDECFTLY